MAKGFPTKRNIEGPFIVGKVRKHKFTGNDPRHCGTCGGSWASVIHK